MKKDFLAKVLTIKEQEVVELKRKKNSFYQLFESSEQFVYIGEVKPKSPTLAETHIDFVAQAKLYSESGVDAISVLTDREFFGGSVELLAKINQEVTVPLLMKDFVIDEVQIVSGLKAGADAVLLIVDFLSPQTLTKLISFCRQVGIEPLVEIQDEQELSIALKSGAQVIGVNSRNLRTLEIDVKRALRVVKASAQSVPTLFLSGIESRVDVEQAQKAGARGVLVGSTLMKSTNVRETIKRLKGEK